MLYGSKENSMLTNCLAACAHLTITVSEKERDICENIGILSCTLAFDAPVRIVPVGIAPPRLVHVARRLAGIELSFHPCNILRDSRRGVFRGNKNVGCCTWKRRFFALAVRITGKLLKIDGYTFCETIWKHRILFPSMQHLAWLPQGRPRGKQKCGKNSDFWTYALI